jgi:hypothetical protein
MEWGGFQFSWCPSSANSTKKLVFWRPKSANKSPRVGASLSISLALWVFPIEGLGPGSRTVTRWTLHDSNNPCCQWPAILTNQFQVILWKIVLIPGYRIPVWTAMNWMTLDETCKESLGPLATISKQPLWCLKFVKGSSQWLGTPCSFKMFV